MSKRTAAKPQQKSNLYRFIRLVLGDAVSDSAIALKWDMDGKNFSDFKYSIYPMLRIDRLITLAKILGVDDHLVYEVAKGTPAARIYRLINSPSGCKNLGKSITIRCTQSRSARPNKALKA